MFYFRDVIIFWINCSSNQKRYNHIEKLLEKYFPGNERHHVEAVMHRPKYQGVTMAHTLALMKGLTSNNPFIILEDDVDVAIENLDIKLLEKFVNGMNGLDALYLGISGWGNYKNRKVIGSILDKGERVIRVDDKLFFYKGAKGEWYDDDFFKIRDMYGAHAILYLNKEYVLKTLKICIYAVDQNRPHDIYLPKILRKGCVYGLCKSIFYQLARIGGQERATKIYLRGVREINYNKKYENIIE